MISGAQVMIPTTKGIAREEIANHLKSQLYNYRHRNNHVRRILTQKELAYLDKLIKQYTDLQEPPITNDPDQTYTLTEEGSEYSTFFAGHITITDHLELLIGKWVKHETFPLTGKITSINRETITINFNGKIAKISLSETDELLVQK